MTKVEGGGVPAGTELNGIYEIEQRIAIGGMGEVYSGRVIQTGDKVAIKMILPEHANNQIILDLFRREASTLHNRSEEHTSELQSRGHLVCRLLLAKKIV